MSDLAAEYRISDLQNEIERLTAERDALREAVKRIAAQTGREANGYRDTVSCADAFDDCVEIAKRALTTPGTET